MLYCTLLPSNPKSTIHRPLVCYWSGKRKLPDPTQLTICTLHQNICTLHSPPRTRGVGEQRAECAPREMSSLSAGLLPNAHCHWLDIESMQNSFAALSGSVRSCDPDFYLGSTRSWDAPKNNRYFLGILSKWVPPLPQYPQCKYAFVVDFPDELSK